MQPNFAPACAGNQRFRLGVVLATVAVCLGLFGTPTARASIGFEDLGVTFSAAGGDTATQAGSHPLAWTTELGIATGAGPGVPPEEIRDLVIGLPPGLVGMPDLVPRCPRAVFLVEACPGSSAIGAAVVATHLAVFEPPLFNLEPPPGVAAQLGILVNGTPLTIDVNLSERRPYRLVASLTNVSQAVSLTGFSLTVAGSSEGKPFLTLPTSCGPQAFGFEADSWQDPGAFVGETVFADDGGTPPQALELVGCDKLGFAPQVTARPTATAAQSPSGIDVSVDVSDGGLTSPDGNGQSHIRQVIVTLPEGMAINAAVSEGLDACGEEDLERETLSAPPGAGCPGASKLGTVEVRTPLFDGTIAGELFVADPDRNETGSMFALYLVLKDQARGILIKQAAQVEPDPATGRLVATLDDLPQLPIAHFGLHFREGSRSPLSTPDACGSYEIGYRLVPWSGRQPLSGADGFAIDRDCAPPGFRPSFSAGAVQAVAGAATPFVVSLGRGEGEQNPANVSLALPPGVSAKFAGVALCSEAQAASGSCPVSSRIGSVGIAAGVGPLPARVPQAGKPRAEIFLAGPRHGAPFSLVLVVPAEIGPFDLGTVVVRGEVRVDPHTAQARIQLDPLPQILGGVPLAYRTVRLLLDRPGFVRNPTSCAPTAVHAAVTSSAGAVANVADRFQVADCAALRFQPRASVRLLGPTHRGAHPRLRVLLAPRPGDANLRRAALTLPGTELLDTRRIRSVCPGVAFAADRCPAAAAYGRAKAWLPLLDRPLEGPVYLRESKGRLPDLAIALRGRIDLDLTGRLDSVDGRLRATLQRLPDAPLDRVVVTLRGGRRGLLVNSGGLCRPGRRTAAAFLGHNGKRHNAAPRLRTACEKLPD